MGISVDALLSYVDRTVDKMADIVSGLGDGLANAQPSPPGANSPYVILRHCLGVMEFWGGQVVAGREVQRDRDAEFRASGPVAALVADASAAKARFRADVASADPQAPAGEHHGRRSFDLETASKGHALLHVLEELTQHLGHMEITRDLLQAG